MLDSIIKSSFDSVVRLQMICMSDSEIELNLLKSGNAILYLRFFFLDSSNVIVFF